MKFLNGRGVAVRVRAVRGWWRSGVGTVLEKNGAVQVGAVRVGAARLEAAGVKVVGGGGGGPRKNGAVWGEGGPGWGRSGWGPNFRAFFFPFPTLFSTFFEVFQVFFVDLCGWFGRFDFPKLCRVSGAGGPEEIGRREGPAEGGLGQGVGGKVVQGRAVRGRRVQGWGVQGRCYRLKKTWPQEQKWPKQHLWQGAQKRCLRQQNWPRKTLGLGLHGHWPQKRGLSKRIGSPRNRIRQNMF